ncbi:MAG: hypothetical protein MJ165_04605, partial [Alphaproteobacteria bacterium]|nr:hypothetical protein [Alphaproteobacteria bacterium]
FQDLGYNVDIFMRLENYIESPFVNYTDNSPRMFFGTAPIIRDWVNKLTPDQYEYVFLSSSAFWNNPNEFFGAYLEYLGGEPKAKHGILMIEHNAIPCLKEYGEEKYLSQHRLFALTENNEIPRLNPHYFGVFDEKSLDPNFVKFVVVGGINSSCKNHTMLLDCLEKLVDSGVSNFRVDVVGKGTLYIPHKLHKYINVMGRLNYKDMYATVNNADYILALLDPTNPQHDRYKTGTTTGSFQLSLGFNKPIIMEQSFAKHYKLTNKNAVVYENDDLYLALQEAITKSVAEYKKIQTNLSKIEQDIYQESLNNLKQAAGQ